MGFNVGFRIKDGIVIDWPQLDKEDCELWGIEPDKNHWAIPPAKDFVHNGPEFLGRAVMLTRAFMETGIFLPSDLLRGLGSFGDLYPHLNMIDNINTRYS